MPSSEKQKRATIEAAFAFYVMDAGYPYGSGPTDFPNNGHAAVLGLRTLNQNTPGSRPAAKLQMPQSGA
jgi:hypothetical protein